MPPPFLTTLHIGQSSLTELKKTGLHGGGELADNGESLARGDSDGTAAGGIVDDVIDRGEGTTAANGGDGLGRLEHRDGLELGESRERGQRIGGGDQRGLGKSHESLEAGKKMSLFRGKGVSMGYPPMKGGVFNCENGHLNTQTDGI